MALTYNQPRFAQNLLNKFKKSAPSFTITLYDDHWTLNKGPSKFLYTQPVSGLLEEVRALRIPVDFIEIFEMAHVPYYDGCMIVESIDYRKPRAHLTQGTAKEPESVRVVLQPTPESFYADLCLLNAKHGGKWTDQEALEIESKILNATCPPLCLEPDVNLTRIVNTVIRASTPSESVLSKRKQVPEPEEDENDKAKRAKLLSQYMHPHNGKPQSQTRIKRSIFDILHEVAHKDDKGAYVLKWKPAKPEPPPFNSQGQSQHNHTFVPPVAATAPAVPSAPPTQQPVQDDQKAKIKAKNVKRPEPQETQTLAKGKKKSGPGSNVPAQPSPVPEQRKPAPVISGVNRTPVESNAVATNSSNPQTQYQQPPQPPKGVLKKPEEQVAQQQSHPPQPRQANPIEQQHTPAAWQPPLPSVQYLSQPPPGKKKPSPSQPQQASPFHSNTPIPAFASGSGYPQNPGFNAAGNPQNPNRGSPMAHNQPLLARSPLATHSQSPHPQAPQPQQQTPQPTQQHPLPQHASHQFNIHMQQQQQQRFNAMQNQMGHPSLQVPLQHGVPQQHQQQQHHAQHPSTPRAVQTPQHDQSQAMLHMQHFNAMQQYPYPQMHVQGVMNGMRMPGAQGAGGQFMPNAGWRMPAGGRGGGPMTTIPMGMAHGQTFQHQHMMAAMARGQPQQQQQQQQQQQPQGQGR